MTNEDEVSAIQLKKIAWTSIENVKNMLHMKNSQHQ